MHGCHYYTLALFSAFACQRCTEHYNIITSNERQERNIKYCCHGFKLTSQTHQSAQVVETEESLVVAMGIPVQHPHLSFHLLLHPLAMEGEGRVVEETSLTSTGEGGVGCGWYSIRTKPSGTKSPRSTS